MKGARRLGIAMWLAAAHCTGGAPVASDGPLPALSAPGGGSTSAASNSTATANTTATASTSPTASASSTASPTPTASSTAPGEITCFTSRRKVHVVPTAGEAIAAFRRGWKECVAPEASRRNIDVRAVSANIDSASQSTFRAEKMPCRHFRDRFAKMPPFSAMDRVSALGDVAALDREGDCWSVFFAGGMKNEAEGFLLAKGLDTIFAWLPPEG